jgi:hypothetical protein
LSQYHQALLTVLKAAAWTIAGELLFEDNKVGRKSMFGDYTAILSRCIFARYSKGDSEGAYSFEYHSQLSATLV